MRLARSCGPTSFGIIRLSWAEVGLVDRSGGRRRSRTTHLPRNLRRIGRRLRRGLALRNIAVLAVLVASVVVVLGAVLGPPSRGPTYRTAAVLRAMGVPDDKATPTRLAGADIPSLSVSPRFVLPVLRNDSKRLLAAAPPPPAAPEPVVAALPPAADTAPPILALPEPSFAALPPAQETPPPPPASPRPVVAALPPTTETAPPTPALPEPSVAVLPPAQETLPPPLVAPEPGVAAMPPAVETAPPAPAASEPVVAAVPPAARPCRRPWRRRSPTSRPCRLSCCRRTCCRRRWATLRPPFPQRRRPRRSSCRRRARPAPCRPPVRPNTLPSRGRRHR